MEWGEGMLGGRDYTGYYRRCDGTIDGIPAAMDADTGEETAIRILFLFLDPPKYYTISKQSLCAFLEVSGGAESRVQVSEK